MSTVESSPLTTDQPIQPAPSAGSQLRSASASLSQYQSHTSRDSQPGIFHRQRSLGGDSILRSSSAISTENGSHGTQIMCKFQDSSSVVEVLAAPVKTLARMREKVLEYSAETSSSSTGNDPGGGWPQAARIVDPVRSSIVCDGPAQILEVFQWFSEGSNSMPICRVKNRFSFDKGELLGG